MILLTALLAAVSLATECAGAAASGPPTENQAKRPEVRKKAKALENGDVRVRKAPAVALGRMGPEAKDAIPALETMLQEENSRFEKQPRACLRRSAWRGDPQAVFRILFGGAFMAAAGDAVGKSTGTIENALKAQVLQSALGLPFGASIR